MSVAKSLSIVCGLLFFGGVTLAGAQATPDSAVKEPAAASLARDLIGEPEGERLAGATLDRRTEEVGALLRCPVCQGLSVADSPTTSALAMREETRDLLASGYTEDQVLAYFERSYGEFIRLSPKPKGFNLVVWIAPFAVLLVGVLVIAVRMRRRARLGAGSAGSASHAGSDTAAAAKPAPAETAAEIPDELASYAERVRREVNE